MINIKKELELMDACKNGNLEKVKSLVEANKFDNKTLEKAKSVALSNMRFDVLSYIQEEMAKNDLNKILPKDDPTDL